MIVSSKNASSAYSARILRKNEKPTDENPQIKTHRSKPIRKIHTQNPYARKPHTQENLVRKKTSYARKPHTDEKAIQMKKSYR
jgi:hypothetical protein